MYNTKKNKAFISKKKIKDTKASNRLKHRIDELLRDFSIEILEPIILFKKTIDHTKKVNFNNIYVEIKEDDYMRFTNIKKYFNYHEDGKITRIGVIRKYCLNYLRHCYTNYDRKIVECNINYKGKYYRKTALAIIKKAYNEKIIKFYPYLNIYRKEYEDIIN